MPKKKVDSVSTPVPEVVPQAVPGMQQIPAVPCVPRDVTPKEPSLGHIRGYILSMVNVLPPEAAQELDQIVSYLDSSGIRDIVVNYHKVAAVIRFWRSHVRGVQAQAEQTVKIREAEADSAARNSLAGATGRVTNDQIGAAVSRDPAVQQWRTYVAFLETLYLQIDGLLASLNTDMLVQASLWTRAESGMIQGTGL